MEDPNCDVQQPQAEVPSNTGGGSPKDVELPPSRWDSPKSPIPERAASPEPNCAICLGALENKSFTNSCMHQFCFVCLLEWSKVKAECPLCKNSFKSIIHNVRSMEDYDQYEVLRPAPPDPAVGPPSWFPWHLAQIAYGDMQAIPSGRRPPPRSRRDRNIAGTSAFRRQIYDQDLWARMQPDVSGRYRECSPQFFRTNPAVLNRLVPFLQRELNVLLPNSPQMPLFVEAILQKLRHHRMNGREFRDYIRQLVGPRHAAHFCHELHAFASSPFDLIGYDRTTEYQPNNNNNEAQDLVEVIEDTPSTSDSDTDDSDSDVQWVSRPTPTFSVTITPEGESTSVEQRSRLRPQVPVPTRPPSPQPGPSGLSSVPSPPRHLSNCDSSVYVVESSDSDECTIVGVVKPRHERTPELITLSSPERTPHPAALSSTEPETASAPVPERPENHDLIPFSPLSEISTQDSDFSDLRYCSPSVTTRSKDKRRGRRTRFNSSGSSSSSVASMGRLSSRGSMTLSSPSSSSSSSGYTPTRRKKRKASRPKREASRPKREASRPKREASASTSLSSHTTTSTLCFRSGATWLPTSSNYRRNSSHSNTKYEDSSQPEDELGPSTSHRLTSVLQRTSSVAGEDIWTVNTANQLRRAAASAVAAIAAAARSGDSDDERWCCSPLRSCWRKHASRSDSTSSESRHRRRDRKLRKHKKKDRSKSKKSKKASSSKHRSKRRKHE